MRLETVKTSVERGGNFTEKAFTIKADAKMFNLLSDRIYSDKQGAVVREIASNAKDAHVAAGCPDRPFDIHLPNEMYPHFSVRDYGKGLTHEEMFEIYTTYSESTKTTTNTAIGAFGVGAKSPFAYTDNFTIVSRTGGRKCTYTAYIGEEGIPVLALMNDEECEDETGLEVIIPIKNYDFYTFQTKTFSVLQYFTPQPNILGIVKEYIKFDDHSYKYQGNGWGVRTTRGSQARVIQGGVFYSIDFQAVYERNIPRHLHGLTTQPLDLYFDMFDGVGERGNLDVALSREALSYDQYTREQIKKIMQTVYDEIGNRIVKDLDQTLTFWEASTKYAELKATFGDLIPIGLKWKGDKVLVPQLNVMITEYREHLNFTVFANQRGYRTGSLANTIYGEYTGVQLFFNDIKCGAKSRVKERVRAGNRVYLIEMKSQSSEAKKMYKKFIEDFGHPPIENVSTLPKPAILRTRNKKQVSNEKLDCLIWRGLRKRSQKDKWNRTTVDLNDGGYYVPVEMYKIVIADGFTINSVDTLTDIMIALNIIPNDTRVYGVGKRTTKHLKTLSNWKNLVEVATESCLNKDVKELVARELLRDDIVTEIRYGKSLIFRDMVTHAHTRSDAIRSMITKITNKDIKTLLEMLLKYETKQDERTASLWQSLSGHVRINCLNEFKERQEVVKRYVDDLSKLWDSIVAKNKILRYVAMGELGTQQFDEAFIEIVNKGA